LRWSPGASACVVASSAGYPGSYKTGLSRWTGRCRGGFRVCRSFIRAHPAWDGQLLTGGGRVLGVTAAGESLEEALARAYQAMALIHFDGIYYRRDIGHRALRRKP
jgi:phosphoribosylamine--glycine ligase